MQVTHWHSGKEDRNKEKIDPSCSFSRENNRLRARSGSPPPHDESGLLPFEARGWVLAITGKTEGEPDRYRGRTTELPE